MIRPASLYIHVPFCRGKCAYCDFYSLGVGVVADNYTTLIDKELTLRRAFLPTSTLCTVYFGGGTPSLLSVKQLERLLSLLSREFSVIPSAEITLEANPDDLTPELLRHYRGLGINRISLGVQSFCDEELRLMRRRHDARRAINAINDVLGAGFSNLSIDLIYGLPGSTLPTWERTLCKALSLNVQHLSCYHLGIEPRTIFHRMMQLGDLHELDEQTSVSQFDLMCKLLADNGFEHYEVSSFARVGFKSKHNCGYWNGRPYLGLGPSAHSYNGLCRQWNPPSLAEWERGLQQGICSVETEQIDARTAYNELIMTRLRTKWGIRFDQVKTQFPQYFDYFVRQAEKFVAQHFIEISSDGWLRIPPEHFFTSDAVIVDLLVV